MRDHYVVAYIFLVSALLSGCASSITKPAANIAGQATLPSLAACLPENATCVPSEAKCCPGLSCFGGVGAMCLPD